MNFFKKIFSKTKKNSFTPLFQSFTEYQAKKLLCGIGKSEILASQILVTDYPFEPSVAYPEKLIAASEIDSICVDSGVCRINTAEDTIFLSAEMKENLERFCEENHIPLSKHRWNWNWILEPYLDTEFTEENNEQITARLSENGLEKTEVDKIRNEVGKQMYTYNFDTMLWEWCSLGLLDVLSAMRAKYNKEQFREFYKRALEIDRRQK